MQVELLVVHGANPCFLDRLGHTPDECARIAGHHDLAERIIECQYEVTDSLSFFLFGRMPAHSSGEHFLLPSNLRSLTMQPQHTSHCHHCAVTLSLCYCHCHCVTAIVTVLLSLSLFTVIATVLLSLSLFYCHCHCVIVIVTVLLSLPLCYCHCHCFTVIVTILRSLPLCSSHGSIAAMLSWPLHAFACQVSACAPLLESSALMSKAVQCVHKHVLL